MEGNGSMNLYSPICLVSVLSPTHGMDERMGSIYGLGHLVKPTSNVDAAPYLCPSASLLGNSWCPFEERGPSTSTAV